jgi:hypothetical protein
MARNDALDLACERLDAFPERVTLIGERKLGTVCVAGAGNSPRDGAIIGDPDDQSAFTAHEMRGCRHNVLAALGKRSYGIRPDALQAISAADL